MTVSVLVPVYNAQDTLEDSLNSLLRQTYQDLEILCVDDASDDDSWQILQRFAVDPRIVTIRLDENMGQAHARNVALSHAHGELIAFLDSDDSLSEDAIERSVEVFQRYSKTGCVLLKVINCLPDGHQEDYPMKPFESISGYEAFVKSLTWEIHGWYIARTELYRKYPFDETCKAYSDDNTTRLHFFHSQEVRTCEGIYFYRLNPSSVTHAPSLRRFDYLRANESMKRQLIDLKVSEEILDKYENVRWRVLVDCYMFYYKNRRGMSPHDAEKAIREIRRVWQNIELSRVDSSLKYSFGYFPFRPTQVDTNTDMKRSCFLRICWFLFRLEEETYFFMRELLKGY